MPIKDTKSGIINTISIPQDPITEEILTPEAVKFISQLAKEFEPERLAILSNRQTLQKQTQHGHALGFLNETKYIREGNWKISGIPDDLRDRKVEITGPPRKKMVVNAMNSGAKTYMADF